MAYNRPPISPPRGPYSPNSYASNQQGYAAQVPPQNYAFQGQGQGQYPPATPYNNQQSQYGPPNTTPYQYSRPPLPPPALLQQQQQQQQQRYPSPYPGFNAPIPGPPQPQAFGMSTPASAGYDSRQIPIPFPVHEMAVSLRKAMKGLGTDEAALISVLTQLDPVQALAVRMSFDTKFKRSLERDIEKETSSHFRDGLLALVRGPLLQDVINLDKAIAGLGTTESLLDDVLLGRSNADIRAIKEAYHMHFGRPLEKDVSEDLSLKTETLFDMVLSATREEDSACVNPAQTAGDVDRLHTAMEGVGLTNQLEVCEILVLRSTPQIRAISAQYRDRYRVDLARVVESHFSGHMQDALLHALAKAVDAPTFDATRIELAMKGLGTNDYMLIQRLVRCHWDRNYMEQVKMAYRTKYRKSLVDRVKGETSGDYRRLCVALLYER